LSYPVSEYFKLVGSVILLSLIFFPLELLAPAEQGQPISKRLLNLAYVPLFMALALFVVQPSSNLLVSRVLILSRGGIVPPLTSPTSRLTTQFLFAVAFAGLWDLWQYWLHRLQHTVPLLWGTHRFHHSETALNATTQSRQHILSYLLSVVFYLPVLVIFGAQAPHYLAIFVMFRLWGFVNHANVRLNLGPLTPIISGPQWHRIHHSIQPEHQDRNFATFFPFIDVVFGTYYGPQQNEYPPSGLLGEGEVNILSEATIAPLAGWYRSGLLWLKKKPHCKSP
jgi:sterol desaturase/sphingolipid hydroxylase (fatty acid hydroxylase superfamily)